VLGCGLAENCDPTAVPFSKIIIVPDPDVDGTHTRMLLLAFFSHYLLPIVQAKKLCMIETPCYRVNTEDGRQFLCGDAYLEKFRQAEPHTTNIMPLRSVAQFNPEECHRYLLSSESIYRRQFVV